jgi:hypothetical protein
MEVCEAKTEEILGIPFTYGPKIFLKPSFALTLSEVAEKINGGTISDEATLFIEGNVTLNNVKLSRKSALIISAVEGAEVIVEGLELANDGLELINQELNENPNLDGFEYVIDKIEDGLKEII